MDTFFAALIFVAFMMVALGLTQLLTGRARKTCCSKNPLDAKSSPGSDCGSCVNKSPSCATDHHLVNDGATVGNTTAKP